MSPLSARGGTDARLIRQSFIAFLAICVLAKSSAFAQHGELDRVKQLLDGEGVLEFVRTTTQGTFAGCELVYRVFLRDFRARRGELIIVRGAILLSYEKGKVPSLMLKVLGEDVDVTTRASRPFALAYASLSMGNVSLERFARKRFECEGGGICIPYVDNNNLELLTAVVQAIPTPGPVLSITTAPKGMDQSIVLFKILQRRSDATPSNATAYLGFSECTSEVVNQIAKDLR
jgi:hypothetical protein